MQELSVQPNITTFENVCEAPFILFIVDGVGYISLSGWGLSSVSASHEFQVLLSTIIAFYFFVPVLFRNLRKAESYVQCVSR
jgi:hypothetical protein